MERSQRYSGRGGQGPRSNQFSRSSSSWKEHRSRHQVIASPSNPNPQSNSGSDNYGNNISNREEELTIPSEINSRRKINQQVSHSGEEESLVDGTSIVGTCLFMCPVEERQQRERLRDLSLFERLDGDPRKTSTSLAVKKFCRTISSKHVKASDVRPIHVLEETLNYLLKLLDSKEHPFEVVHDFIFDRTRSIRQDLTMQNIVNDQVIKMYEKMVRFHIASSHKLHNSGDNPEISSMCYLNMEQLMKVLASLYHLYEENRKLQYCYSHEPEFYSFYVLLHLDPSQKPEVESLSLWFRRIPSPIIKSKEMCFARKVLRYYRLGYYKQFISTVAAEASDMQCYIIEPSIHQARLLALCCVNYGGYKLHPYPLADLSKIVMMKMLNVFANIVAF
ncbi:SAC3 family protein C isoform X2 [Impatiens glandulifera]|uniref:SAC3 family protein C isoform X2 n=1 Tax=Impatiens glandulifera TaxID=253017 RepID=UPI001FB10CA4|nr:SAC3 family protein C isoform X2 [Impatiens glandulifera]